MTEDYRIDVRESDFDTFMARVSAAVVEKLDVTSAFEMRVGFPSSAFPLAPERTDSASTLTSINHEFILFTSTLRKSGQKKLLLNSQGFSHLAKLNLSPYDIVDTGEHYVFQVK